MELIDIYNENGERTGLVRDRTLPLAPGEYHLGAIVVIGSSKGEVLCTLRSQKKHIYPGLWENTGGGALAGETSLEAALRELKEETGIHAKPEELTFLYRNRAIAADGRGVINDIYGLRRNLDPRELTLQPEETEDAKWIPYEEWEALGRSDQILTPAGPDNKEFFQILRKFVGIQGKEI